KNAFWLDCCSSSALRLLVLNAIKRPKALHLPGETLLVFDLAITNLIFQVPTDGQHGPSIESPRRRLLWSGLTAGMADFNLTEIELRQFRFDLAAITDRHNHHRIRPEIFVGHLTHAGRGHGINLGRQAAVIF